MADTTMKVDALTLTDRMKDMGVVGMWPHGALWFARFKSDPDFNHILPPPVAEWLLVETATVTITLPDDFDPLREIPA